MAEPWICPNCSTPWLVARGQCTNCGYGVTQPPPPGPQANDVLGHLFAPELTALEQRAMQEPSLVQTQQALMQTQQEAVQLAQQLTQVQQEHQALMQGVQRLLAPLAQWWQSQGHQVTMQDLIPRTVQMLTHQTARPTTATPDGRPVVSDGLVHALDALRQSIEALHAKFSAPPEPYPTWLQSDARVAQMEQAIGGANALRGEGFRG